jgi:predicted metal-binding protein
MDDSTGCPGEWRCLKAAAEGDGTFDEPSQVVSFIKCQCPGRTTVPNVGMAVTLSETQPDKIYLSSCMTRAEPACPNQEIEDLGALLEEKFSVPVVKGTHDYS